MATFSKILLSGGTDGQPVKVAATSTPGTTIHTAHNTSYDELWLWATNTDSSARTLTIEFGGTTDPDNLITKAYSLPANSQPTQIVPGIPLTNAKIVKAFASAANVVLISGYVNRIT